MAGKCSPEESISKRTCSKTVKRRAGWERVGTQGWGAGNTALLGLVLLAAETGSQRSWGQIVGPGPSPLHTRTSVASASSFYLEAVGTGFTVLLTPCLLPSQGQAWSQLWGDHREAARPEVFESPPTVCPPTSPGVPHTPHPQPTHSTLGTCRLYFQTKISPNPVRTVFPKHVLVTMNQRAGGTLPAHVRRLVDDGRSLLSGQLGSRWAVRCGSCTDWGSKRHPHEPSGIERGSLVFDNREMNRCSLQRITGGGIP